MTIGMAYTYSTLVSGLPGWRESCSFALSGAGSGELPLLRPLLLRSPFASGRWRSRPRRRAIIPAIPRRRRRPTLDILLRRPEPRRRLIPAMVIPEPTPAMVIPEPTPAMVIPEPTPAMVILEPIPAMVIREPTPIIHTPIRVGLVGVICGVGAGVGPGSRSAGAGAAGGVVAGVGTAGSAAASAAGLLMPVSMAEGSAVASTAVAVAAIVS